MTLNSDRQWPRTNPILFSWAVLPIIVLSACTTYSGVTVHNGQMYLAGSTSYLIYGKSWVKRCIPGPDEIECQKMEITDVQSLPQIEPYQSSLDKRQRMLERSMPSVKKNQAEDSEIIKERMGYIKSEDLPSEAKYSIAKKYPLLKQCIKAYSIDTEEINVTFTVSTDGSVEKLNYEDNQTEGPFETCISRILKLIRFPEYDEENQKYEVEIKF